LGKLDEPEVIRLLNNIRFKPMRKAIYGMLLAVACTEEPYRSAGDQLGMGRDVGFTVYRLWQLAKTLHIPFERSRIAYDVYDRMVKEQLVKSAQKTERGKVYYTITEKGKKEVEARVYTLYTITEKGKEAAKVSLENIQRIIKLGKMYEEAKRVGIPLPGKISIPPGFTSNDFMPYSYAQRRRRAKVFVGWTKIMQAWKMDMSQVIGNWIDLLEDRKELSGTYMLDKWTYVLL